MARRPGRSDEELEMRDLIVPKLRLAHPSARIIHELPLRYSSNRIDLAAVTEDAIVAVEIKSSRDVMDRLESQIRAFQPVCSKVIVALAPKWNPKAEMVWEQRGARTVGVYRYSATQDLIKAIGGVETWTVCAETKTVEATSGTWVGNKASWATAMLDMLWRDELEMIAVKHRVSIPKRASHIVIRDACEELMTGREVRRAVCHALRTRKAFDKASDEVTGRPAAQETAQAAML